MNNMLEFRGTQYSREAISKAVTSMGYLVWMKLPYAHFSNADLGNLLEADLGNQTDRDIRELHEAKLEVENAIVALKSRGIKKIRVGASWAEAETPGGWVWICWYLKKFHDAGFEILPNLNYTPEPYARARIEQEMNDAAGDRERLEYLSKLNPSTNIPPEPLSGFADFVDKFISALGQYTEDVIELWNEPNIDTDWLPVLDPNYDRYVSMFSQAATRVRAHGKKVLLGAPSKTDPGWFKKVGDLGLFDYVDIIGIHGLRGTWSDKIRHPSWEMRIEVVLAEVRNYTQRKLPVWITEVGFTTVDLEMTIPEYELEEMQAAILADLLLVVANGSAERIYWYTLRDLVHPSVRFITTGWEDILQFYFGDIDIAGHEKLLGSILLKGGPEAVLGYVEDHDLWETAYRVIDRGNPADWPGDKLQEIMKQIEKRARSRRVNQAA